MHARATQNVASYLEHSAWSNPHKIAVVDGDTSWTYQQLLEHSKRAGTALCQHKAQRRAVVLVMEKSAPALALMMGALMAGAYYVPVDPQSPAQRLQKIVHRLQDPLVVTAGEASLEGLDTTSILSADELLSGAIDEAVLAEARACTLETDPAYVLFTSGTTGEPKGVAISHHAIATFISSFTEFMGLTADDRFANQAPLDFDVSTKDIYGAFSLGATLVLVDRRLFMQPAALVAFLQEQKVTVLTWAVAALCIVSGYHALDGADLSTIRKVLFSGEVMPRKHLAAWRKQLPQATFVNLYGPTEITCNCLYHVLNPDRCYDQGIPLGASFPHCRVTLVAEDGSEVTAPGSQGELVIGGPTLALGYIGMPEQTAAAFTQSSLQSTFPERVYRSGDLATITEDGEWLFAGRKDHQIKFQGHRIELEEIESTIESLEGITRCRCVLDTRANLIRAFFEGSADSTDAVALVRSQLPSHMRPASIERVETMPLTAHGKIDRARLLEDFRAKKRAQRAG